MSIMVSVFDTWASTVILLQYHIERITIEAHIKRTEKERARRTSVIPKLAEKKAELVKPVKVVPLYPLTLTVS